MLKGSGKLKVAGLITLISSAFVAIYFTYSLIMVLTHTSQLRSYMYSYGGSAYSYTESSIITVMILMILYHVYKLIIGIHAVRKANEPKSSGAIMGNSIVLLILSLIWLLIVGAANSQGGDGRGMMILLLLLALTDTAMLIVLIVGAAQNKQPAMPWGGFNPYGAPNQYGMPNQPPFGAPNQPPYGAPNQPPYGVPNQPPFAAPNQPPYGAPNQPPFGAPNPNGQFGGFNNQFGNPPMNQPPFGNQPMNQNPYGAPNQFNNQNQSPFANPNQSPFANPNQPAQPAYNHVVTDDQDTVVDPSVRKDEPETGFYFEK